MWRPTDPHQLWKDDEDRIHADGYGGDDRTLCGDSLLQEEGSCEPMVSARGRIDCPHCLMIIAHARAIPRRCLPKSSVTASDTSARVDPT